MLKQTAQISALAVSVALAMPAQAVTLAQPATPAHLGLQAMRELNLIVLGDMRTGSQVEGKSFIAGNLTGASTFGAGRGAQGASVSARRTLTVGGNVTANINLNNGPNGANGSVATTPGVLVGGNFNLQNVNFSNAAIDVGGNLTGNNLNLSHGQTVNVGGSITASANGGHNSQTVNAGGTINGNANGARFVANLGTGWNAAATSQAIAAETQALTTNLTALSTSLRGLTLANNPSSVTQGAQGPTFSVVAGGNSFALFNIDGSLLNTNQIAFTHTGSTMPIIVNVSGTNINWTGNSVGGFNAALNPYLIWNFYEASDLRIGGAMKHGSILAPLANLVTTGVDLEGSIVAKNFTQSGQVHLGTYQGDSAMLASVGGAVPEPASWAMLISGFGLIGAVLRRRRIVAAA